MDRLDQQLRDYYQEQKLPSAKVESILESGTLVVVPWWRSPRHVLPLAAVFVFALLGLGFMASSLTTSETSQLAYSVAKEVAKAHNKALAPEVVTQSYTTLQAQLHRVDFSLQPKADALAAACTLLGGRYCSIQGELAAQLRLQDARTGTLYTLFVTKETPQLEKLKASNRWVEGDNVRFWREGDRFFALAGPAPPPIRTK